ncbi:MAG: cellulose binding domain-containing protein, partial [Actinomycetota bacterium]
AAVTVLVAAVAIGGLVDRADNAPIVADGATDVSTDSTGGSVTGSTVAPPVAEPESTPTTTRAGDATTNPATDDTAGSPTGPPTTDEPTVETEPASTPTTDRPTTDTSALPPATASGTSPGLRTSTTRTSAWEDGYCFQMEVVNDGADGAGWQIVLELGGTVDTIWNARAAGSGDQTIFSGLAGYNTDLDPRASTSFGACITTTP